MKYINTLKEGDRIREVYYCKSKSTLQTKLGKDYFNVLLQDKTGVLDSKIWDTESPSINEFSVGDFVQVEGDIKLYSNAIQANIIKVRVAEKDEYEISNFFPISKKDKKEMEKELDEYINSIKNIYYKKLLKKIFVEDEEFRKKFISHQGGKSVHHSFINGLIEHTLSTTKIAKAIASTYDDINIELVITASLLHDIGKIREISDFPENDYTDEGQLIGHIVIGYEMLNSAISKIENFPNNMKTEILHCMIAHHGKQEFGSPKLPSLMEAYIVSEADDIDAKIEIMREHIENAKNSKKFEKNGFTGFNKYINTNIRECSKND